MEKRDTQVVSSISLEWRGEDTMRAMLDRLFAGRNGVDQLNIALFVLAILFWMASLFSPTYGFSRLFHGLCLLAAAFCIVRALSRNLGRRQQENQKFLSLFRGGHAGHSWRVKMEQRRQYKIFRCPSCGIKLRVPRGKGKIKVTCRQCGATFEKKSWWEAPCICKKMKKALDKPWRRWYIIKAVTEKQKKRWRKKKNIFLTKAKSCAKVQ